MANTTPTSSGNSMSIFSASFCTAGCGRQDSKHPSFASASSLQSSPTEEEVGEHSSRENQQHKENKKDVPTRNTAFACTAASGDAGFKQIVETSLREVRALRQQQRTAFLKEAAKATSMVPLSRGDQKVALSMLVSEAWRYNTQPRVKAQRKLHGAPQRTSPIASPRLKSLSKTERASLRTTCCCLMNDVRILMSSTWPDRPEATAETHPYLFTMKQLTQQRFFDSPKREVRK